MLRLFYTQKVRRENEKLREKYPRYNAFVTDAASYIDGKWYFSRSRIEICLEVTAWMPFPEPYKEDEDENTD